MEAPLTAWGTEEGNTIAGAPPTPMAGPWKCGPEAAGAAAGAAAAGAVCPEPRSETERRSATSALDTRINFRREIRPGFMTMSSC